MTKTYPVVIIIIVLVVAAFLAVSGLKLPSLETPTPAPSPSQSVSPSVSDLIKADVISGQTVKSPLALSGEARGFWFFEASFPVKIYDADGIELGVAIAQAEGDWMTEDFVGFHAVLQFKKPSTTTGFLVFQRDNPSGLPENDAELRVPVKFDLANWPAGPSVSGGCKVSGCSGQLCIDSGEEEAITTCEWKDEYACYQTAKCEKQEDGKCGWTPTEELVSCLGEAFRKESL